MDYNGLNIVLFIMVSVGFFVILLSILWYTKKLKEQEITKKDILIISFISVLIGLIPCIAMDLLEKKWKEEHWTGIYQCPRCQSYETEGCNLFWDKDNRLCNGSREWNLEHAYWTIIDCENCGNSWKLYKKDW